MRVLLSYLIKDCLLCAKSLQSCPALCDPMEYRLPASSVHGILQARLLEWVAISSQGLNPCLALAGVFFTTSTTWEVPAKSKNA